MPPDRATVLVLPGLNGSGPRHWQSLWEARLGLRRVEQADWDRPSREDWVATLERAVASAPGPVVLVAHSLGCALVAHWARSGSASRVRGALLVAPSDVDRLGIPEIATFSPLPLEPLPFRSIVVASADDPYVELARARGFAAAWRARLVEAGPAGHLNTDAGYGEWPAGEALLEELVG